MRHSTFPRPFPAMKWEVWTEFSGGPSQFLIVLVWNSLLFFPSAQSYEVLPRHCLLLCSPRLHLPAGQLFKLSPVPSSSTEVRKSRICVRELGMNTNAVPLLIAKEDRKPLPTTHRTSLHVFKTDKASSVQPGSEDA